MRPNRRRILIAALIAVGATTFTPQPAAADCVEDYVECQIAGWQKSNWLIRELKFIVCFADYVGCVRRAAGF